MLIMVLIVLLIAAVVIYLIDMIGLPHPAGMIAKIIVVILALLYVVRLAGVL